MGIDNIQPKAYGIDVGQNDNRARSGSEKGQRKSVAMSRSQLPLALDRPAGLCRAQRMMSVLRSADCFDIDANVDIVR